MPTPAEQFKPNGPRRTITTSLTDETIEKLEAMRRQTGFSRSGTIAAILDQYFSQQGGQ